MTDISMCKNKECPLHKTCWRFNAPVNAYQQAYGFFRYRDGCDAYKPMNTDQVGQIDAVDALGNVFNIKGDKG